MPETFSIILLTTTGDYLLESEEQLEEVENGFEISSPHVINEEEKAQEVQADKIFIPMDSIENIQHGSFQQETV